MRIISTAAFVSALALATGAFAADRSLILKTSDTKGYGKRDRVFFGSEQTISPSQLHELYGARVDAGFQFDSSNAKYPGESAQTNAPTAAVRGYWGGDILSFGLGGGYTNSVTATDNASDFNETVRSRKVLPSAAITVTPNITLGASSDVNWIDIKQQNNGTDDQVFTGYLHRESVGLSFHYPKLEVGVAYVTPVTSVMGAEDAPAANATYGFGLYSQESANERSIYLPAHGTIFARGNLTDHFSMQAAVSQVQLDRNVESVNPIFDRYRQDDHTAAQVQAVYWMSDLATRVALTGIYRGATYAPYGTEETGLGYRSVNLYGGSLDGAVELKERTYLGLSVGYLRGERNQDLDDDSARVSARETRAKIATTLNMNI